MVGKKYNHLCGHSRFCLNTVPEFTQPWCEYPSSQVSHHLVMGSGATLHPTQGQHPSRVLPHRAGTNFIPWWGVAVAYGNSAQCFRPSSSFVAGTGMEPGLPV